MRLLLDTHAFIWFIVGDLSLSATAVGLLREPTNDVFVSAATAW